MKQIGRIMKIFLKDHVIVGKGWFLFLRGIVGRIVENRILDII